MNSEQRISKIGNPLSRSANFFVQLRETALHKSRAEYIVLAAKTANLAENLPDGVTTGVAIGVAREEEHLADLLFRICLARTIGL